jgi:Arylsulfotransferase (ASST)
MSRRGFVLAAAATVGGLAARPGQALDALAAGPAAGRYVSRPDLAPPPVVVATAAQDAAPGYVFLAPFDFSAQPGVPPPAPSPYGPLIVDSSGEPVWFLPFAKDTAMNFHVQQYHGRPALTWYAGIVSGGYGGNYFVFDDTYHELKEIRAGRGEHGDLHEFLLTPDRTALISIYRTIITDLRSIGGSRQGKLVEGIVQEIELATGRVIFEWHSFDHVAVDESYRTAPTSAGNVDYFHLNSIDIDKDHNLLISARHTSAIYKVDRLSGNVIWRLGGKRSDFSFGPGARFAFQHDARRRPDGTITVFDNRATDPGPAVSSRGLRIAIDENRKRASLVRAYTTPTARNGFAMGNVQQLPNGGVFVGWGTDGSFSEFAADGTLRYDARFGDGSVTYRAFRTGWTGVPDGAPAAAARRNADGTATVYASWNGATRVARWQIASNAPVARTGFETALTIPGASGVVSAVALDATGRRLGASAPIQV